MALNYSAQFYNSKIDELSQKCTTLNGLISRYNAQKSKISTFFEGESAIKYEDMINDQINSCERALQDSQETMNRLKRLVQTVDEGGTAINNTIDTTAESVRKVKKRR